MREDLQARAIHKGSQLEGVALYCRLKGSSNSALIQFLAGFPKGLLPAALKRLNSHPLTKQTDCIKDDQGAFLGMSLMGILTPA